MINNFDQKRQEEKLRTLMEKVNPKWYSVFWNWVKNIFGLNKNGTKPPQPAKEELFKPIFYNGFSYYDPEATCFLSTKCIKIINKRTHNEFNQVLDALSRWHMLYERALRTPLEFECIYEDGFSFETYNNMGRDELRKELQKLVKDGLVSPNFLLGVNPYFMDDGSSVKYPTGEGNV